MSNDKIVVNREQLKRIHDLRLAEICQLRELLNYPPLLTGKEKRRQGGKHDKSRQGTGATPA